MHSSSVRACVVILMAALMVACHKDQKPDFYSELPPGAKALRKIGPAEYPDFSRCMWNFAVLPHAVDQSLQYIAHGSARKAYPYLDIDYPRAVASLRAFRLLLDEAAKQPDPGKYIDQQIRDRFEVYKSIGGRNPEGTGYTDTVLFTGYCTPDREASLTPGGAYRWPIYKRPSDLATDKDTGEVKGRQLPDGSVAPYWTRAQIEGQGKLTGQELAWLKSRWEAYVVTVQGSARLKLPDGRIMIVGYAGNNGYNYTSPSDQMIQDGILTRENRNIRSIGAYFDSHPEAMDKYLWLNQRFVFFTETSGDPVGCLNVPVTEMATLATDKEVYPRAMPAFLIAPVPVPESPTQKFEFHGFMMDQDAGGAIRAAGRADIYMGIGDPAEQRAGHQLAEGALYYIAIKPDYIPQYQTPLPAESLRPAPKPKQ